MRIYLVYLEALRVIKKERLVHPSRQPTIPGRRIVCSNNQQVLLPGYAIRVVMNERLIPVKRQPVIHIPLDVLNRDDAYIRCLFRHLSRQRSCGVVYVEILPVKAQ